MSTLDGLGRPTPVARATEIWLLLITGACALVAAESGDRSRLEEHDTDVKRAH